MKRNILNSATVTLTSLNMKSLLYKNHQSIHPPIELILNENIDQNSQLRQLKDPPVLVFDPFQNFELNQPNKLEDYLREVNEKDGLFYYLLNRPEIGPRINNKRRIFRLLVCVTVYSENFEQLSQTLDGIYQNLAEFKDQAAIGNEDIAVVVQFDGCENMHSSVTEFFEFMDKELQIEEKKQLCFRKKIFCEQGGQYQYKDYPKTSSYVYQYHLYPYNQPEIEKNYLQVFFSVKLQNNGKLSSHAFFFRAFCETFQPMFCALVDCGTIPARDALFNCFISMEVDSQIGGVCGYMGLNLENIKNDKGIREDINFYDQYDSLTKFFLFFFDVQKAQKFEYSFAHIIDKSFESFFGFIHVLPGAFSAYRWEALTTHSYNKLGQAQIDNMLEKTYLISVLDPDFKLNPKVFTVETANMMLAEDRILCLEIFTRKNYILKYIPNAACATDPIKYFLLLMKQRRRWINGSWFALNHVLNRFPRKLQNSTHSIFRKISFLFSMLYAWINQITVFCTFALYFVFLNLVASSFLSQYYIEYIGPKASAHSLVVFLYISSVSSLFYFSLFTHKPESKIKTFSTISSFLGLYMLINFIYYIYLLITIVFLNQNNHLIITKEDQQQIKFLALCNLIFYGLPTIFKLKEAFTDIIFCLPHYLYYSPAYLHTLLIFAFCNVDDLSWGTKGSDQKVQIKLDEQQMNRKLLEIDLKQKQENIKIIEENFKNYKVEFVGKFIAINCLLAYIFLILVENIEIQKSFIQVTAYYFTGNLVLKSICAILFQLKYYLWDKLTYKIAIQKKKPQFEKQAKQLQEYIRAYLYPNLKLIQNQNKSFINSSQYNIDESHIQNIKNIDNSQIRERQINLDDHEYIIQFNSSSGKKNNKLQPF